MIRRRSISFRARQTVTYLSGSDSREMTYRIAQPPLTEHRVSEHCRARDQSGGQGVFSYYTRRGDRRRDTEPIHIMAIPPQLPLLHGLHHVQSILQEAHSYKSNNLCLPISLSLESGGGRGMALPRPHLLHRRRLLLLIYAGGRGSNKC